MASDLRGNLGSSISVIEGNCPRLPDSGAVVLRSAIPVDVGLQCDGIRTVTEHLLVVSRSVCSAVLGRLWSLPTDTFSQERHGPKGWTKRWTKGVGVNSISTTGDKGSESN